MDREDIQLRRADNQVWNGARDYDLRPEFHAFDAEGDAELYFNTIIGLAARYYDFSKFKPLLNNFQNQAQGEVYTELFWLAIEGLAYRRGCVERPALEELRREYARGIAEKYGRAEGHGLERVRAAWFNRALDEPGTEDEWEKGVLDALTLPLGLNEAQIAAQIEALLYKYYRRARRSVTDRQWAGWVDRSFNGSKRSPGRIVSRKALRRLAQTDAYDSESVKGRAQTVWLMMQGKTPEPILQRYVEAVFGKSMLTPAELAAAEKELCTGAHENCRLHFTRGVMGEREPDDESAWELESFRRQRAKNREYFAKNLVQNRIVISRLTQRLQNTILLQQDVTQSLTRAGRLAPEVAWRAGAVSDEKVFSRQSADQPGELVVDIMLDGSASQNRQQEKLATQAYIIAESLTRCNIPVRVSAFCSVSGCTVMSILRDYNDPGNDGLFDYVAAGWNRDGLAMRAMGWLMRRDAQARRMLIILSDANPNDDQKIPGKGLMPGKTYGGKAGIEDAAHEAAALRLRGVLPLCVFTGSDMELPGARSIYGKNLTRIPTIGWFADAVGKMIQGRIKEMG